MTRLIGIRNEDGSVDACLMTDDGAGFRRCCSIGAFWLDPWTWLATDAAGEPEPLVGAQVVPPVLPDARVFCIGLNYLKHVAEGSFADAAVPQYPTLFARWPRSLTVDGASVPVPVDEDGLDWEGEVVAWVGATLIDADPATAADAVIGYSAFNDITARRAQKLTSQWILGKNGDRSGPLSPMVPASEVGDLRQGLHIETRVNGEIVQQASTDEMVYSVGDTLALISRTLTLRPGDLLATGTPAGVGYARNPSWLLHPGDEVEVSVEKIGRISNRIVDASHRRSAVASISAGTLAGEA